MTPFLRPTFTLLFSYLQLFLLFVFFNFSPLFAQKIVRGPYLQMGSSTGMVVRWRTDVAVPSRLTYGLSPSQKNQTVSGEVPTTEHELRISNLTPNAIYYYGIQVNGATYEGDSYYFKTAPPTGSKQKIRFWALGDAGDGSPNQREVRDAYLKRIQNDNRQTDAVLFLGDNAYAIGTDEEYQNNFFNIYQESFFKNNVIWAIPGNHEYYSGAQNRREVAYFQIFSQPQNAESGGIPSGSEMNYSFDYGNVHVVALDSYGIEQDKYRLYDTLSPQVEWLKKDLAANRLPWTIVMFHHPPYTKNSHDSDTETELILIRQNLNPILERYKVDLVLSGHSHLYERSRPMRGHTGLAPTFNEATHLTSTSSGMYNTSPNSCAYVKNGGDEGVIYVVAGSSGRNNGLDGPPHPAMPYKNFQNGGSVIIEVEDNRLNYEWLCNDGVVRDQFTIFKNVNKTNQLKARHGETVTLTPSWKGSAVWSNGSKQPSLAFTLTGDTTFTVRDEAGCLLDRFVVTLTEKPVLSFDKPTASLCAGGALSVPFSVTNTDRSRWNYTLQLSDAQGNFSQATTLATESSNAFSATLPASLPSADNYRLRIVANVAGIAPVVSANFSIQQKPSATLSGTTKIDAGQSAQLTLQFTGSAPWTYQLSTTTTATTSTNPLTLTLSPLATTVYTLTSVSNGCGTGSVSGSARVEVTPKVTTQLPPSVTLCNESAFDLPFSIAGSFDTSVNFEAQLSDKNGDFTNSRTVGSGAQSPLKVSIPANIDLGGDYRLRVKPVQNVTAALTPSDAFSLKQRAKVTISGDTTIAFGGEAKLKLTAIGSFPISYTLSDNSSASLSSTSSVINVTPTLETTYSLKSVSNACGNGSTSGSARVNVLLTAINAISDDDLRVLPNPTHGKLHVEAKVFTQKAGDWELMNPQGKVLQKGHFRKGTLHGLDLSLDDTAPGTYLLRFVVDGQTVVRKVVKQ